MDGDRSYFMELGLKLEYLTKIAVAGALVCPASTARRREIEGKILEANSIGGWNEALAKILKAEWFDGAGQVIRDFTQKVRSPEWQYEAVHVLRSAAARVGVPPEQREKRTVALRDFFDIGANLRNRTRGHGATTYGQMSSACRDLACALDLFQSRLHLFGLPWAYLHKQLAGTFRVSPLLGDDSAFSYLRSTPADLQSGVYVFLRGPIRLNLVQSDTDLTNIYLPNGNYKNGIAEWLSYFTDTTRNAPVDWLGQDDQASRIPEAPTDRLSGEHRHGTAASRETGAGRLGSDPVSARGEASMEPPPSPRPRLVHGDESGVEFPQRSPVVRHLGVLTANTLPIYLDPPGAAFKEELLRTKEAWRTTFYENGDVQVRHWDASNMTERSNVLGNLRSRPEYRSPRWRELGIAAVQVTIDPVFALKLGDAELEHGCFDVPAAFDRYVLADGNVTLHLGGRGGAEGRTRRAGDRYGTIRVDGGEPLRQWFANTGASNAVLLVRIQDRERLALDWAQGRGSDAGRGTGHLTLMSGD